VPQFHCCYCPFVSLNNDPPNLTVQILFFLICIPIPPPYPLPFSSSILSSFTILFIPFSPSPICALLSSVPHFILPIPFTAHPVELCLSSWCMNFTRYGRVYVSGQMTSLHHMFSYSYMYYTTYYLKDLFHNIYPTQIHCVLPKTKQNKIP